ncbi:MAG: hypothetical protein ACOC56_03765 [Atribacterota bacterium]
MTKQKKKVKAKKQSKKGRKKVTLIEEMDDFYSLINKVQMSDEYERFTVIDEDMIPMLENIIKDSDLVFERQELKTRTSYILKLGDRKFNDIVDVDLFEQEMQEELEGLL